nr:MAG TPA: Putative Head Tail Connector Protein [Caudoviricetes sp.]
MSYLTKEEFTELGFECEGDFYKLLKRAKLAIDAYTRDFYFLNSFESDNDARKRAVKLATAYQIAYLDSSGVMTAEDKQSIASMSVGRTSVSYRTGSQNSSGSLSVAERYNLSKDTENWLRMAGFGYARVGYDR